MADSFDVFFSYATTDHAVVERVARALGEQGIRIFFDRWYLAAGRPWPQALEQTLTACGAVAVFIGANGLGAWQQRERDLALDRQGREPTFPVIPVLLTPGDAALGFLRLNTWVNLSGGLDDPDALAILAAAIRREPPGPRASQRIAAVRAAVCPYRGLRPFREEDEPFFFGRASFTETLCGAVLRHPLVAVVGASGSGKSSVVRAGLIPRLRRGAGSLVWDVVTTVPTDRPFQSLARALLPMIEPRLSEVEWLGEVSKLAAQLADGTVLLRDVAERVLQKQPGTDQLLLFVDQWEELYTLGADHAIRRRFVDHLLPAAASGQVRVVLTLRADFMGHALADRPLADQLQDSIVTIGPMTRDELADTIVRPAEKVGLVFDEGLVETILDDVGNEPGSLPLLEFLLEGLWAEPRGNVLTHEAFARLGRVAGAIAHRAEEVFNQKLTGAERTAARRLLVCMIRFGDGVEDTRRRTRLCEDDAVAAATIRKLVQERLVVTQCEPEGAVIAEVAHEALIRRWQRLRDWVDKDREFLRMRQRIAEQARLWESEGRPSDRLLSAGRPLIEGEDILETRRTDLQLLQVAYIEASASAARAKEEAGRASQRRRVRSARLIAMATAILALVAMAGGAVAWRERGEAQRNAEEARSNAEIAQLNNARVLAALAEIESERGSPANAIRLALASLPMQLESLDRSWLHAAAGALLRGVRNVRELRRMGDNLSSLAFSPDGRILATGTLGGMTLLWEAATGKEVVTLRGHDASVSSVAFSPDGQTLATGSEDHTARLWNVATGQEIITMRGHEASVSSVTFSPDGQTLATGSEDHTARLWNVATGQEISTLRGHESSARSVAFSPDGKTLATGSDDHTARLWDVATGQVSTILHGHEDNVTAVAFSPDGRMLATASEDDTARLWNVATGLESMILRGRDGDVESLAFSPDGKTLATGSAVARLWEVASGKEVMTLLGHEGVVMSLAFSPDGRLLVTGSLGGMARLWGVAGGRDILRGHEDHVTSVAFSPGGQMLATGSDDNTARLWDVATGQQISTLRGHESSVLSVAFSPNGRMLATGSVDSTVRLWDVATGGEMTILRGHESSVHSVAFSPDGETLATGSDDNTARLWNVATGQVSSILEGHEGNVISVAFSPDGRMLATGSDDNTVRLWNVATGRQVMLLHGHKNCVDSVAFSPDGRMLATGSCDLTARLWEVATGEEIALLRGHWGRVKAVAFSPDGRMLATAAGDLTARLWEVASGKEIALLRGHEGGVTSVAFNPDGRMLVTGSADSTAQLWPGITAELVYRACARVHNLPLSETEKQRFGIETEWCTPDVSQALRAKLGMDISPSDAKLVDRLGADVR